jgi:Kdo2-lipid IVA lauroyltransferase/acyltransferase
MEKQRSRVADYAVYLIVRVLVCVIQAVPYSWASKFAVGLAWVVEVIDRRHRLVARENLRHAFPEQYAKDSPDPEVSAVYRHFCGLLIEIMHLPRLLNHLTWRRHLALPNGRVLVEALTSGRPLLLLTGHFGNWELGGFALGLLGFKTYAIARPLDNPYLDAFLRRFRERTGQGILAKHGDFDQMKKILAGSGVLATLADQDAGRKGVFVDFFGRPASTHKAVALLALQYNVSMAVIGVRKVGEPIRYVNHCEEIIDPQEYQGRPDAVAAITQRFTSALERLVRLAPEQYFWLHRRWKHEPPKSRRAAA